jgi:hypothetical protein
MAGPLQSASGSTTVGNSITLTLGAGTSAGSALVVYAGTQASFSPKAVSGVTLGGSAGNFAAGNTTAGLNCDAEIWLDLNCATGQTSVVVTFSGSVTAAAAYVEEWPKLLLAAALDQAPSGGSSGSSASFTSNATGTLAKPAEVGFGFVIAQNGATVSITGPSSPWTNTGISVTSDVQAMAGYQQVNATSALTYSGTLSPGGSEYACVIVTVKELAAAGLLPALFP